MCKMHILDLYCVIITLQCIIHHKNSITSISFDGSWDGTTKFASKEVL